ncbi:Type 1 glutamine amidotransferase-like domain-containing protein [Thalassobacillus hwangdonensis]|uniref:Type 1 glutamine amidotransferase-like domain-containing protein n=1 Tax=Thalassobacillus hwangdonensis TaxID=546108 RepID=A0ABW3L4S5_9BACI
MGELILSGGGDAKQNQRVNSYFSKLIRHDKTLLYIPLAGDPSHRSYEDSLKYIRNTFNPLGIEEIEMWTELTNKTAEELERFTAIYFSGGSTTELLRAIRSSGFDEVLLSFYEKGGIIYGQSAGAIIFGRSIEHTLEETVHSEKPLDLANGFSIWAHYDSKDDGSIESYDSILALSEGAAVHMTKDEMHAIGEVYLFDRGTKQPL